MLGGVSAASTSHPVASLVLERLEPTYRAAADPVRAVAMRAYMRDQFPFLGVPAPQQTVLARTVLAGLARAHIVEAADAPFLPATARTRRILSPMFSRPSASSCDPRLDMGQARFATARSPVSGARVVHVRGSGVWGNRYWCD